MRREAGHLLPNRDKLKIREAISLMPHVL